MAAGTAATGDRLAYSQPETKPRLDLWILDQLTLLAEAFGESGEKVSGQRLEIYVRALGDLPQTQLATGFSRALAELKFFPKVAELRDLACTGTKELRESGAQVAWHEVLNFLSKWGVDRRMHAVYGAPLKLGSRTEFAIRCVGGLDRINRAPDSEFGYLEHQFVEAWRSYDVAKALTFNELIAALDGEELKVERVLQTACMEPERRVLSPGRALPSAVPAKPRVYGGAPLSDENWQVRQAELRNQAAEAERRAAQIAAELATHGPTNEPATAAG
jgi:hypothetical protein